MPESVFIFPASPPQSVVLRHRLQFKSSKQFWEAELLSEQRNNTELGWKDKNKRNQTPRKIHRKQQPLKGLLWVAQVKLRWYYCHDLADPAVCG